MKMKLPLPPEEDEEKGNEAFELLKHACKQLMLHERFDTIQIVATFEHQGGTSYTAYGIGNVFARIGSMKQVIHNCLK